MDEGPGAAASGDHTRPLLSHVEVQPEPRDAGGKPLRWRPFGRKQGLGTFGGVFVPCMISIIGVILYLRLGWAVGQAGVLGVLGMFAVGAFMALLTDLSLSAMATNGRVGAGGTYYLISRNVGPQFGGAVGLMFYAANTIGMAFYLQGFTETMASLLGLPPDAPSTYWIKIGVGTAVLLLETVITIISSDFYAKCAFIVFMIQMGSIWYGNIALLSREPFSWFSGHNCRGLPNNECHYVAPNMQTLTDNLLPEFSDGYNAFNVFGILFPAITGIMAGTNMSGVLRRPDLAIPRGELSALGCAMATYVILVFSFGASVPRAVLKADKLDVSWWPWGLTFGILTSTMSSAMASMQSSSRLLQAIAQDELIPFLKVFRRTWRSEPAIATAISVLIAQGLLMIGSLDAIAPILTMFFILTYATTNFATFAHSIAGHPNFRPRFRFFSWHTALLGGIMCIVLMFALQWIATIAAVVIAILISWYITRHAPDADWGEVSQSLIFHQVRKYLLRLDSRKAHIKFWRVQVLALVSSPHGRVGMLEFVNNMKKGGLFVIGDAIVGSGPSLDSDNEDGDEDDGPPPVPGPGPEDLSGTFPSESEPEGEVKMAVHGRRRPRLLSSRRPPGYDQIVSRRRQWLTFVGESGIKAFVSLIAAPTLRHGVTNLLLTTGLGGMRPNTLLLEFYDDAFVDTHVLHRRRGTADGDGDGGEAAPGAGIGVTAPSLRDRWDAVYDPKAPDKMRSVEAAVFWHKDEPIKEDDELRDARGLPLPAGWAQTPEQYVGIAADASACGHNVLIMRAFAEMDKQNLASFSRPDWAGSTTPLPRDPRHMDPSFRSIDVWDVPWGSAESYHLATQLAAMLWDADFWHAHTYLRACSLVEADVAGLGPTRGKFGQLHQMVVRDHRIRAAIHMFILTEDDPVLYQQAVDAAAAAAPPGDASGTGDEDGPDASSVGWFAQERWLCSGRDSALCALPPRRAADFVHAFIRRQSASAAVTFLPMPSMGDVSAAAFVAHLRSISAGLGPVVLVRGVESVIAVEL